RSARRTISSRRAARARGARSWCWICSRSRRRPNMYPMNAWYVAGTPNEIDADKPLGRMICGQRLAIFRGPEGKVAALEDFCPHRGAPLSLGRVREGNLVCGYHGLAMGSEGKAVSMPLQRVHGFPAIRVYPAIERYGF